MFRPGTLFEVLPCSCARLHSTPRDQVELLMVLRLPDSARRTRSRVPPSNYLVN